MPLVSVIIPTFNRARWVRHAIHSVLEQSFGDFELIVVDDGSTDETPRLVAEVDDRRMRYVRQGNGGVSSARNTGIGYATGPWLAFLDSDDEWSPRYLATQLRYLDQAEPKPVMQAANCRFVSRTGTEESYFAINGSLGIFNRRGYAVIDRPFRFILQHSPWQLGATLIRRTAAVESGLFDPELTISEDLDLMGRVSVLGPLGLVRQELVSIYRREEETLSLTGRSSLQPVRAREVVEEIYRKWAGLPLHREERIALHAAQGANRRAIGNLYLDRGDLLEARGSYRLAMGYDRSVRSIGKYALALLRR